MLAVTVAPEAPARAPIPGEPGSRANLWLALAVGTAVAFGIVLRFVSVSELWLDEALTVNIAELPWGDLEEALRHDGAPPLFYALLHLWIDALGSGNEVVRALSGIASVASLPLAYFAGRRIGGRRLAWIAVVLLATSPYAIRYATEARMYALESLLVLAGYLALVRALERPSLPRLGLVAFVTALLLYNQYWSPYLVAVVGLGLVVAAVRSADPLRRSARLAVVAIGVGVLAFVPWVPTLSYQLAHTGTPWGEVYLPPAGFGLSTIDFAGARFALGWILAAFVVVLPLLGVFARAVDDRHVEVDLQTVPDVRWVAAAALGTLVVGLVAAYVGDTTFEGRYAAVVFPLFILVAARGLTVFADARVQIGLVTIVAGLGLAVGVQHATEERTQADAAAGAIEAGAEPGDVVVYCPDQLGPAVDRLLDVPDLRQLTFPDGGSSELVDWADYVMRVEEADPRAFADRATDEAGEHAVWLVSASGYQHVDAPCAALAEALRSARPEPSILVAEDSSLFEYQSVTRFEAR